MIKIDEPLYCNRKYVFVQYFEKKIENLNFMLLLNVVLKEFKTDVLDMVSDKLMRILFLIDIKSKVIGVQGLEKIQSSDSTQESDDI